MVQEILLLTNLMSRTKTSFAGYCLGWVFVSDRLRRRSGKWPQVVRKAAQVAEVYVSKENPEQRETSGSGFMATTNVTAVDL